MPGKIGHMSMSVMGTGSDDSRPKGLNGGTREFAPADLQWIASQFQIGDVKRVRAFEERGNINLHTFEIESSAGSTYLLQRLNTDVFAMPERVMDAMLTWIEAQHDYLQNTGLNEDEPWEPISLIPTHAGIRYLDLSDKSGGSIWRMMTKIDNTVTFKSLSELKDNEDRLKLAHEVGRGLALNANLTSSMRLEHLKPSLPGYRDTRGYLRQMLSILQGNRTIEEAEALLPTDPETSFATQSLYLVQLSPEEYQRRRDHPEIQPFIQKLLRTQEKTMRISDAIASGKLRMTAIHGDTKIDNFLFCRETGRVRSLVDLDTIMPFTWLADWGDMVRSLCNVAGEKEPDLSKIKVDFDIYESVAKGFLSTATSTTMTEVDLMPEAVEIIALELGMRFLTDYLRGDTYFTLGPGDPSELNRIRGQVQIKLAEELESHRDWTTACVGRYVRR